MQAVLSPELPESGIERRLVRRAEYVWDALRDGRPLPPAPAVNRLIQPPFTAQSLLFAFPPHPGAPGQQLPRIVHLGSALHALAMAEPGEIRPSSASGARLAEQLASLAERAVNEGGPLTLERDAMQMAGAGPETRPGHETLLLRAVALPFAPSGGAGALCAVIVSWRQILSEREAAQLADELRAVMAAFARTSD
jgi:hypothetical protein